MEKRAPNEYPRFQFSIQGLKEFPETFELAFNDHFGFRRDLITLYKLFMYQAFNISTDEKNVVIGDKGWLFLGNDYFNSFDRHTGIKSPSTTEVDTLVSTEKKKRQWLHRRGIKYLFAVAPDKYSIYPEYLPSYVRKTNNTVLLDLFLEQARKNNLPVLDLRPPILKAKAQYGDLVYAKTDSHWSTLGAFYGYEAIVNKLIEQTGPIRALTLKDFTQSTGRAYNLEGLLGLRKFYKMTDVSLKLELNHSSQAMKAKDFDGTLRPWTQDEEVHYREMMVVENNDALNPLIIFMLRDSFSNRLSPLFNLTFSEMAYTHYNQLPLQENIVDLLLQIKPQVVLHEMVEQNLAGVNGVYTPWDTPLLAQEEAQLLWPELPVMLAPDTLAPIPATITLPATQRTNDLLMKIEIKCDSDNKIKITYTTEKTGFDNSETTTLDVQPGKQTYFMEAKASEPITKIRLTPGTASGAIRIISFEIKEMSEQALRKLYQRDTASAYRTQ